MTALIDYASLQTTVATLIQQTGSQYSLIRPAKTGDVVLAVRIYGTFDKQIADRFAASSGGVVSMQKKTILLPVINFGKVEPRVGDRLTQGKYGWRIDTVEVVRPDGVTTLLYTCDIT